MKRLVIEHYKTLGKADFYTIRFTHEEKCETDLFISRFVNDLFYQNDFSTIIYWLNKMGEENGTLERFFRPEKGAKAIPISKSNLRLYCIRLSDELIILGNGGIKTSQKIQDSPDAYPSFYVMVQLEKMLRKRRASNGITISGRKMEGKLEFEITF